MNLLTFRRSDRKQNSGFTLIEMLIVIAIIAALAGVIIPKVVSMTKKAKAATDVSNIKVIYEVANVALVGEDVGEAVAKAKISSEQVHSKSFPDAEMYLAYNEPTFVDVFFVDDGCYYGIKYFTEVAETGSSSQSTENPYADSTVIVWENVTADVEGD